MKRLTIILCVFTLFSCQDKVICPAFQSTYILDDSTRDAYFSYVWQLDEATRTQYLASLKQDTKETNDTIAVAAIVEQPKTDYYAYAGEKVVPWRIQKRTKFGIIKNTPRIIKNYQLRTAPMENVLGPEVISNEFVASDFSESLGTDSTGIASDSLTTAVVSAAPEEKQQKYYFRYDPADNFNVEQEYYNKYFGTRFIDDRPEPKMMPADSTGAVPDSLRQEKVPFFKKLFQKKAAKDTLSTNTEDMPEPDSSEEDPEEQPDGNGGE